jgi:hypothetical protein
MFNLNTNFVEEILKSIRNPKDININYNNYSNYSNYLDWNLYNSQIQKDIDNLKKYIENIVLGYNNSSSNSYSNNKTTNSFKIGQNINIELINKYNQNNTIESNYVPLLDINIKEGYQNINIGMDMNVLEDESNVNILPKIPDDILCQLYFISIGGLGIYLLYRSLYKLKMIP